MIRLERVPAGWLSAPDLVSRFCDFLHAISEKPLDPEVAAGLAALCIADQMAKSRPGVAAFAMDGGQTFMLPGHLWRHAIDEHLADDNSLTLSFVTGRCWGGVFGDYQGLQLLFSYAETMIWLEPVATLAARTEAGEESGEDPLRPWVAFNSPKAWLMDAVAATRFADALLSEQGQTVVNERARRRVLDDHLRTHGVNLGVATVGANRRAGGHTV